MTKFDTIQLQIGHTVKVEVSPTLESVIHAARASHSAGLTKLATARQIYPKIAHLPRESIWYAFIHGMSLSSRGAVTYYYNMLRESRQKKRVSRRNPQK